MYNFPRIPKYLLLQDVFRGENKQVYLDSNREHQLYKELKFVQKWQQMLDEITKDYKRTAKGNYCPLKLEKFQNKMILKEFGVIPFYLDYEVV